MAKQHFYSRVPSKVSMFYKSNGFDTFALSEGVTQEFVEKELNNIIEQKLTPEELSLIRINKLSPVYCHFSTRNGTFVESCISYITSDYTGERSSYLVHTLVYNEKEEKTIHSNEYLAINESNFLHNLDSFDILSSTAKPIKDYPEANVLKKDVVDDIKWLTTSFDPLTFKRLIFAVLASLFGKYKSVFVILPDDSLEYSLKFFNSLILLFPYHLRKYISFVSSVRDFNKFQGYLLKVINSTLGNAPVGKGVTIDFRSNMTFGMKDNDFKLLTNVPDMLYRFITKDEERKTYFDFVKKAVSKIDVLGTLDFKTSNDLMFLYLCSCGLFDEKVVLKDDDTLFAFFNVYEKYREAMIDEYRMNAMKALRRYPTNYLAIPKNIFNKLSKIYPSEINGTKYIIMNVILDLIHTDLMRQQLFNFIKAVYDKENKEMKSLIIKNLANVFYGGFLQEQIIDHFKKYFEKLNEEDRILVLDKIFQSIRTVEIQESIFNFVYELYSKFSIQETKMFYSMAIEHFVEGDDLAKKLLKLCDDHIIEENEDVVKFYRKELENLITDEQKRKEMFFLPVISESSGFTFDTITKAVFTKWRKRKITIEFIALSCRGSLKVRIDKIIRMWDLVKNDIDDDLSKRFIDSVIDGFNRFPCECTLSEIFEAEEDLINGLKRIRKKNSSAFINKFKNEIFNNLIKESLMNVFTLKESNSVEKVIRYSKGNESITSSENYIYLENYLSLKTSINNDNIEDSINYLLKLSHNNYSKSIGNYLLLDLEDANSENIETIDVSKLSILKVLCSNYLITNHFKLSDYYNKCVEKIKSKIEDNKQNKLTIQKIICELYMNILSIVISILNIESDDEYLLSIKEEIADNESGIIRPSSDIVLNYGNKQLKTIFSHLDLSNTNLDSTIHAATKKIKSKAGLFGKVVKPWI